MASEAGYAFVLAFPFDLWFFWLAIGLALGSFTNVVIHRLPRERSVVNPGSHCPRCKAPIAFYDNIPVLSWLLLRGKSRCCGKPISARYPAVEAFVGAVALGLWWRWFGWWPWVGAALLASAGLTAVALIDWDTFIIPDELSLGLWLLGTVLAPFNPMHPGSPLVKVAFSVAGGVFGFALCFGILLLGKRVFKKDAMGGGDVKLLAAVGAWTGVLGAYDCIVIASFLGAAYGVWQIARKKLERRDHIPFGPFLSAAAVFNFFYLIPFGFPFHQ
jgi:leader peptidase (prepilin peptidase)/N-methyltransferase